MYVARASLHSLPNWYSSSPWATRSSYGGGRQKTFQFGLKGLLSLEILMQNINTQLVLINNLESSKYYQYYPFWVIRSPWHRCNRICQRGTMY